MLQEYSTICVAVDGKGYSVARFIGLGRMTLEHFVSFAQTHFEAPTFLSTDMNPIYQQYSVINRIPHYVINSNYRKNISKCKSQASVERAYEADKLDYILSVGSLSYKELEEYKTKHKLSIQSVNAFHSDLKTYINRKHKGVSTKYLQAYCDAYTYIRNYKVDNGHLPRTEKDAYQTMLKIVEKTGKITINDMSNLKYDIPKVNLKYTKKAIGLMISVRTKSNNKYYKISNEDGFIDFDKKHYIKNLPEYKVRRLAKHCNIKPYSPTAVSKNTLVTMLLKMPDINDKIVSYISEQVTKK